MKKIFRRLSIALMGLTAVLPSFSQTMTVTTRDGETHSFATADVKDVKIDYVSDEAPFEIEITDVTAISARLNINPADSEQPYYFDVCTKADYERMNGNISAIVENYFRAMQSYYPQMDMETLVSAMCSVGPDSDVVTNLPADADMVCYVIGVEKDGTCVGESATQEFHTLPGGRAEDCTFDISYSNLGATQLTVIVNPSDPTIRYWMGVYSTFDYPGDESMPLLVKANIQEYATMSGMDIAEIVQGVTFAGSIIMEESGLEAGKTYYIYVYAMDEEGNAAGPVSKLNFTTALEDYSNAGLELAYRYFDGDAMAAAYPDKFANAKGAVILQPVFTPNEETVNYAWALAAGDYTDPAFFPDDATRQALLSSGYINVPTKNLYVRYGDATFLYYGSDMWGVEGRLSRTLVHITPEGVSPVAEYYDVTAPAPVEKPAKVRLHSKRVGDREASIWKRFGNLKMIPSLMRNPIK